jgi:hypothetical protein
MMLLHITVQFSTSGQPRKAIRHRFDQWFPEAMNGRPALPISRSTSRSDQAPGVRLSTALMIGGPAHVATGRRLRIRSPTLRASSGRLLRPK